jgi:enoyl-CoA hydratase
MTDDAKLREDRPAPHVRRLTLDDPATRNALGLEMRAALVRALHAAAEDRDCRVVVITGTGKVFAAGSDIRMLAASTPEDVVRPEIRALWEALVAFPKPLVAALNGHALGGGLELALTADIILAARGAKLGNPEPKIGIMPGGGATQRLTQAVGKFAAMHILLRGEPFSADAAMAMGLASELVGDDEVEARALQVASELAALPVLALQLIKESVLEGMSSGLESGLRFERRSFQTLFSTHDKQEGMRARLEKRAPTFTGN